MVTDFDMAVLFDGTAMVYLRDDTKILDDVVEGDELLCGDGGYHKVGIVYRPKSSKFSRLRYSVAIGNRGGSPLRSYIDVGEDTEIMGRRYERSSDPELFDGSYDLRPSKMKVSDLKLMKHLVEVCVIIGEDAQFLPMEIMKISMKRGDVCSPYLIGIDGGSLIVSHFVVHGCDAEKVSKLKRKEERYAKQLEEKTGTDSPESSELREGGGVQESECDQDRSDCSV